MPMITAEIFAPVRPSIATSFAQIIHHNAVAHLHARAELLTIKVGFSQATDEWFFNLAPLNSKNEPSFYVFAPIGNGVAAPLEVARFVVETRDQLRAEMESFYPGTSYPALPDRTKVVVVEMP